MRCYKCDSYGEAANKPKKEADKMSEQEKPETHADIIAEMREIHVAEFQDYADRLDAAHRRDMLAYTTELRIENERLKEERNSYGVRERRRLEANGFVIVPKERLAACGNEAALREALREAIGETCLHCTRDCGDCLNLKAGWMAKAKAALAEGQEGGEE